MNKIFKNKSGRFKYVSNIEDDYKVIQESSHPIRILFEEKDVKLGVEVLSEICILIKNRLLEILNLNSEMRLESEQEFSVYLDNYSQKNLNEIDITKIIRLYKFFSDCLKENSEIIVWDVSEMEDKESETFKAIASQNTYDSSDSSRIEKLLRLNYIKIEAGNKYSLTDKGEFYQKLKLL